MKVSINWLREYLDFDCSLTELADGLTMAGLEVEETINLSKQDFINAGGGGLNDDTIFDVKVTPNRGDWLSMIGVAREAAPLVNRKVKLPEPHVEGSEPSSSDLIKIRIDAPDLCRRYAGVMVRNVEIKESPDWMKDRLIAAGLRPINNVVDITNYVMMELGQPLHAFDYSLLRGAQIIVRRAEPGETITSLDGIERKLEKDMLVIADNDRAVAIAGVMGGADSEISKETQDILIESANFNNVSVRRTSKILNMVTESSYRFERGVDPSICAVAALRAAELIRDLAGGEICRGVVDVCPAPIEPLTVDVRPDRVNSILGTYIEPDAMARYLNSLDINATFIDGMLVCQVPTFRSDVTREIDLIEEIGRAFGYDKLGMTLPDSSLQGKDSREGAFRDKVRRILMSCGAQEVLTHSVIDGRLCDIAGRSDICLKVRNPLSEELNSMRVMLVPNLLQVIGRNQSFGTANVTVFEIGKIYYKSTDGEIGEKLSVAGVMVGNLWRSAWSLPGKALDVDFFMCKGMVESLLSGLGVSDITFEETTDPILHPTRGAKILINSEEIGFVGEAAPEVGEAFGVRGRPYVFEMDFTALMQSTPEVLSYKELPKYPAIYRHLAVVVSDDIKYKDVEQVVLGSGNEIVEGIDLLDVYKGEHINPDQRSLTLSIVFRSRLKTLTDEEVNTVLTKIMESLKQKVRASFR